MKRRTILVVLVVLLVIGGGLTTIELLYPTVLAIAGERAVPGPVKTVLPRDPDRCRICLSCEGE